MRVPLRLPPVEDHHHGEVWLGPREEVGALDFIVIEVDHLIQSVELRGAVAHDHDDVGPVRDRPFSAGKRHDGRKLIHAFGGFTVRVRMVVSVSLEALGATVVEDQGDVGSVVLANEGRDLAEVIEGGASRQGFHFRLRRLPAKSLMEVEAELGQERRLKALEPQIEVGRLHGLLGLASKEVFPGFSLPFEHLTPCLKFGMGAVQVQQRRQEMPLGDLRLASQQLRQHVHLHLEAVLEAAQDWMVESERNKMAIRDNIYNL